MGKKGLQALSSGVEVDRGEYDGMVAVKAIFLSGGYR